ncbi:MAG: hypothetical protein M3362_23920 [Acidobacteriota bacterium]|nr:hypothetical protein [Acidobacteriota bacterium]
MKVTNQYVYLDSIPTERAILWIESLKLATDELTGKVQTNIFPGQRRYSLPQGVRKKDIYNVWIEALPVVQEEQ